VLQARSLLVYTGHRSRLYLAACSWRWWRPLLVFSAAVLASSLVFSAAVLASSLVFSAAVLASSLVFFSLAFSLAFSAALAFSLAFLAAALAFSLAFSLAFFSCGGDPAPCTGHRSPQQHPPVKHTGKYCAPL
jgi:hypothetical protein